MCAASCRLFLDLGGSPQLLHWEGTPWPVLPTLSLHLPGWATHPSLSFIWLQWTYISCLPVQVSRSSKMELPEAHPGSFKMELLRMLMLKNPGSSILNQKLQNEAASLSWEASIWSCQPSNRAASLKSKLPGWASGSPEAQNRAASSKTKLLGRLGMCDMRDFGG